MIKIFLIFLLLLFVSCSNPNWYKPMGSLFRTMPKGGTPGFELGWQHGCESGLGSQFGGAIYMSFYSWKRDPDIASSKPDIPKIKARYKKELAKVNWNEPRDIAKNFSDYNSVFWLAHKYCRHAILGMLQTAGMNPTIAGDDNRYDPGAHSLGNIWKINGRGDTRIGSSGLW